MYKRLSDYALIGNSRAAALVSSTGCIDWCCLPEFDSPAIFAALLDEDKGGHFSICPAENFDSSQGYVPETNVVETLFQTGTGKARILESFTAMTEEEKRHSLFPEHEVLRIVEVLSGNVQFDIDFAPRTYYGRHSPVLTDNKTCGIYFHWKEDIYTLLSTLDPGQIQVEDGRATGKFSINEGERVIFCLTHSRQSPAVLPELKVTGPQRMQRTIQFWRKWINQCKYSGWYEKEVKRSALALKLLSHAPTGSIIAAPTTSLPEKPGGERNWDYRYCWLRDASFTTRVLLRLGFEEEAEAYMNWILHATRLTRPELKVFYTLYGDASAQEQTLEWLNGYQNSRPVRIGNGADGQFQLDVYGEVLDAVYTYASRVENFASDSVKFLLGLGEIICRAWDKPDNGIWEVRSDRIHHTHSMALAWVGLDRLTRLAKQFKWRNAPINKFSTTALAIRQRIERDGYNAAIGSYTRELNGDTLDASVLTLSLLGYCDASSPRMRSTCRNILEQLTDNGLVYRYKGVNDGLQGNEGCFGICSFWMAENLANAGELDTALEIFDGMLKSASPAGLLSEEINPETHEMLGNYPQAFTHIGLINAAMVINEVHERSGIKI